MSLEVLKISFIVVEYHSIEDIITCYSSIIGIIPSNWQCEVIVSSNSVYPLKQQEELKTLYKDIKWRFNEKNGGFAYAMNQGLSIADGDILVIMNPDVRLKTGIEKMVTYLYSHNEIGVIAPKIININGKIQDSFRDFITPMNFIKRHLSRIFKSTNQIGIIEVTSQVDWVIGAFMMMPRQAYEVVKGLDEYYFLYCEDMDFCKRIQLEGFSVVYYPESEIEYEVTRSARRSLKYACIFLKSLLRYWTKFGFN